MAFIYSLVWFGWFGFVEFSLSCSVQTNGHNQDFFYHAGFFACNMSHHVVGLPLLFSLLIFCVVYISDRGLVEVVMMG